MKIETKYSLMDAVICISSQPAEATIHCECCKQTGKVTILGVEYTCPKCNGNCRHKVSAGRKWLPYQSGIVGQVRFEHTVAGYESYNFAGPNLARPPETEIKYMLDSSGVRSGNLWEEGDLFPSWEEAQAECDKRNEALRPDEV